MDIDFQIINKISVIIINLVGIWLVFWVYYNGKKKTLNRGFIFLLIPNLLWINLINPFLLFLLCRKN